MVIDSDKALFSNATGTDLIGIFKSAILYVSEYLKHPPREFWNNTAIVHSVSSFAGLTS